MSNDDKKITVVTGDDSDLDISPVYDHLDVSRPKSPIKKEEIVIPKVKKVKKNTKNDKKQ